MSIVATMLSLAPPRRQLAAGRRRRGEAKQPRLQGHDPYAGPQSYDDDDDESRDDSWDDD